MSSSKPSLPTLLHSLPVPVYDYGIATKDLVLRGGEAQRSVLSSQVAFDFTQCRSSLLLKFSTWE